MADNNNAGTAESDADGRLLEGKRRTVMKAAAGAIGASVAGSAMMGSASTAPGDNGPFQIDFVFKHGIKSPLDSTGYSGDTSGDTPSQGRLIRWLWSDQDENENEGSMTQYNSFTDDRIGCDVTPTGPPNVDYAAGTVTQEFTIQNCTPSDWDPDGLDYPLALYSYVAPDGENGWDPTKASEQRVYHESRPRFSSTGTKTITIDIPYLDTPFGVDLGYGAKASAGPYTYANGLTAEERDGAFAEAGTKYNGVWSDQNSTYGTSFLKPDTEVDNGNIDGEIYLTGHLDEGINYYFYLESGDYDIIFHLNELRKTSAGERIFDINIDGSPPSNGFNWTDIDLFDENDQNTDGYGQPNRRWVNSYTVTDNILKITPDSKTDKALINGIEIRDAGNNPYDTLNVPVGFDVGYDDDNAPGMGPYNFNGSLEARQQYGNGTPDTGIQASGIGAVESVGDFGNGPVSNSGDDAAEIYASSVNDGGDGMTFDILVKSGTYDITIHMCEVFFGSGGSRVFDIDFDGTTEFANVDIAGETGGAGIALEKTKTGHTVTDNLLSISTNPSSNNGSISGIEIQPN